MFHIIYYFKTSEEEEEEKELEPPDVRVGLYAYTKNLTMTIITKNIIHPRNI